MGNNGLLNDEELQNISGGATTEDAFELRRKEFNEAWDKADMDGKGFSGMQRGELFDKWDKSKKKESAKDFLSGLKC